MQESNLDVNLIIQTFQEKVSQLITELVVKEATIKQMSLQIQQLQAPSAKDDFEVPTETVKKVK
jgi:UDP-N-acetylglucosamine:LPS N-acetylglucosamine transferase